MIEYYGYGFTINSKTFMLNKVNKSHYLIITKNEPFLESFHHFKRRKTDLNKTGRLITLLSHIFLEK